MGGPESRTLDDEGLPRPPAVRGKIPRSVLRILVHAESVMFMAIARPVVIAVVVFARGGTISCWPRGAELSLVGELTPLVRRFARLDRA